MNRDETQLLSKVLACRAERNSPPAFFEASDRVSQRAVLADVFANQPNSYKIVEDVTAAPCDPWGSHPEFVEVK